MHAVLTTPYHARMLENPLPGHVCRSEKRDTAGSIAAVCRTSRVVKLARHTPRRQRMVHAVTKAKAPGPVCAHAATVSSRQRERGAPHTQLILSAAWCALLHFTAKRWLVDRHPPELQRSQ